MFGFFFFQAEDGIRDVERSRGLGDVYKRQVYNMVEFDNYKDLLTDSMFFEALKNTIIFTIGTVIPTIICGMALAILLKKNIKGSATHVLCVDTCLLYTSDAADDTPCVDLGGRRIIKKKKTITEYRQLLAQKQPSHTGKQTLDQTCHMRV
eukprot:TRINITY_DN16870_c0_g1_i1.p1 TRINITY_DN16870_c0_g1~~TRINITY_DN16870_c0_g1_i1.p1  ORF type:complete len:151 (-),score=31.57 TRINITY_DN16870_c0_g1_i1:13-465(-)